MSTTYLTVSERLAVDMIERAATALTLSADLPPRSAKRVRELARAVRLWTEVRQQAAALHALGQLREAAAAIEDSHADALRAVVNQWAGRLGEKESKR